MVQKDHFRYTLLETLNLGSGFHDELIGAGEIFPRGGMLFGIFPGYEDADAMGLPVPGAEQLDFLVECDRFYLDDHEDLEDLEYFVADADTSELVWWSLADHPHLAYEVADLPTYEDNGFYVRLEAMLAFLQRYGPLTPSFLRYAKNPQDEVWETLYDDRNRGCAYRFSDPARTIRRIVGQTAESREGALLSAIGALDGSPCPSLYRALLIQLIADLVGGKVPRRCAGCGKWFTETENESQAVHRQGWKRADARYHSRRCMKAARERERRARLRTARQAQV